MTEKIMWRIALKSGAQIELPLEKGDKIDQMLKEWVESMPDNFSGRMNDSEIWLNPTEFCMASRIQVKLPTSPRSGKIQAIDGEFERVDAPQPPKVQ